MSRFLKFSEMSSKIINEVLSETKPRRAWSGKIGNIDKLLSWMYAKGILTKSEQNQKDSLFRQYYRYYNDGDHPRTLSKNGIYKWDSKEKIETALEEKIDTWIKGILSKYSKKVNRTEFRYGQLISELSTIKIVISDYNAYGLINYWSKKTKINDTQFGELLNKLSTQFQSIESELNTLLPNIKYPDGFDQSDKLSPNQSVNHIRMVLRGIKQWPKNIEASYQEMVHTMDDMSVIVESIILATKRLKSQFEK